MSEAISANPWLDLLSAEERRELLRVDHYR